MRETKMLCLRCKNEEFGECMAETSQVFRGETFAVKAPSMACKDCGWLTMTDEQADVLRLKVADAYREKHELLTSAEIRQARETLGLSQQAFAQRASVGVASIKRWETAFVQDKSSDLLIRLRINEMTERGVCETFLLDWFDGACLENVITLASMGIRLLPKKEPPTPSWTILGHAAKSRTYLEKNMPHDPAVTTTA